MKGYFAALVFAFAVASAHSAEVAGVKLDDKVKLGSGPELVLNGAGIRTRVVVNVYVGALYLAEKKTAAADVLALAGPKRVSLSMLRDVTAQQLTDALKEGIDANNPAADVEKLKPQIDELTAIMTTLGQTKKGDTVLLDFVPGTGTTVTLNGAVKGKAIGGDDFYRALLRVWLGDKPVDSGLKKAMLGG